MRDGIGHTLFAVSFLFGVTAVAPSARAQVGSAPESGHVYTSGEVDVPAALLDIVRGPKYPDALRSLGLGGKVLAQFVIDTSGRVDTTSVITDDCAQPLFAASVREALATMHFSAAKKAGHKVPVEVQQSFLFRNDEPAPVNVDSMLKNAGEKLTAGPAAVIPGSARPEYPDGALRAGFAGIVQAQFVIDSSGRADPKTFKVISVKSWQVRVPPMRDASKPSSALEPSPVSPDQDFVNAVRTALPRMRFVPAQMGGRNVRQRVDQPFNFDMSP